MPLLADILLGLFTPPVGGGTLDTPTLAMSDDGDEVHATATITTSDPLATNTLYIATYDDAGSYSLPEAFTEEGNRTGDGTITVALSPGRYWAYVLSSYAGDYAMSALIYFRVSEVGVSTPTAGDVDATTALSLPRLRLMELVAACPTFQSIVGASGPDAAEDAMASVHSPYSDDHLDGDGNLTNPRPRCIINTNEFSRNKLGTAYGGSTGSLILCFEFEPKTVAGAIIDDPNERLAFFEEQIGEILDEMEARCGQDKTDGDAFFTDYDTTHLNITRLELVGGPAESNPQEERGELFLAVVFIVEYIG